MYFAGRDRRLTIDQRSCIVPRLLSGSSCSCGLFSTSSMRRCWHRPMPQHWPSGQPSFPHRPAPHILPSLFVGSRAWIVPCGLRLANLPCVRGISTTDTRFRRHRQTGPSEGYRSGRRCEVWDPLQPLRLVWEGLEGITGPSMSMPVAAKGLAFGWGAAPGGSHANLETAGGEFA